MSQFIRPTFNVDDDDLERLQQEFFANEQTPAAKVIRKSAPPSLDPPKQKKRSLFAERLANKQNTMPALEDVVENNNFNMPSLEDPSMPVLENTPPLEDQEDDVTYEPVMDPNPEPHVPVSKKMLDLTSLLGQVLGDIKEHNVSEESVKPPTIIAESVNKPARGQHNGFPKPVHRSEFKKRLEAKRAGTKRLDAPPSVTPVMDKDENTRRIEAMSEQELEDAREEIMNTLSPESIALLMRGLKNKEPSKKKVTFEEPPSQQQEDDLIKMKEQYFPEVPLENEKLAWMDARFATPKVDDKEEEEGIVSEAEKVYRRVRFDLQGRFVDPNADIPVHRGLHHHGDEPEKAGYTLAELFYLTRSQVPSQRAMVLTTLARIIQHAKRSNEPTWKLVWSIFVGKEHGAVIYLRSALDDRHLVVLVSAIHALSAFLLDETDDEFEERVIQSTVEFNQFLGHIAQPVLPQGVKQLERKGLNEKLTELVDRVRQGQSEQEQRDDAALAEKDLVRGLIKMNLLPRIRYLFTTSELENDPASAERLVRILVRMAEAGQDVCEQIEDEEVLDLVVEWGLMQTQWPMTTHGKAPSLASVRLLTVLAQGSKQLAESLVEKATITLRFLVTNPEIHELKRKAYALQLETLKLIRVLACYGFIVPTLEDLQEPVMGWLRKALSDKTPFDVLRASTAIGLLEILLHVAADPHKSIPAHAIDWHQPTAYLPAVTAVLRAHPQEHALYDSCLGYLGAWASYLRLFPPEPEVVREVWKAVVSTHDSTHRLRYVQFLSAYHLLGDTEFDAAERLASLPPWPACSDMKERYAFWLWSRHSKTQEDRKALEYGLASRGVVEAWVAQQLLQMCLHNIHGLEPFYFDDSHCEVSKALYEYDGRPIKTLMYASSQEEMDATCYLLSPIDAFYHLDKSRVAQKIRLDAAEVVEKSMILAERVLGETMDHAMMIVTLMKVFLIGDREGRQAEMVTDEREVFMNEGVSKKMDDYLDVICQEGIELNALEGAWRRSSEYIREAQVPFYQFYQGFVAQYAAVSFGHMGFARLLVYLVTQIDTIDYRHLVFSDYRDILATLNKVGVNQVPPFVNWKPFENAGLKLSK